MMSIWLFIVPSGFLFLSLFLTLIFYQKSIMILRDQPEFDLKSTKSYIMNLRYFSLAQLVTYGPIVMMILLSQPLTASFGVEIRWRISDICECLASLSGFISAMIFICRGSINSTQPKIEYSDNDLTQEII